MNDFQKYIEESQATLELEDQIIIDKLKHGLNGIEWIVLNTELDNSRIRLLKHWLILIDRKGFDLHQVVVDVFLMSDEVFFSKYRINKSISMDESISYLVLEREAEYSLYFELMRRIEKAFKIRGELPNYENN